MVLTPENEKMIRDAFRAIYETKQEAKALNQANTELMKSLAESLQVEKSEIADAYKYWQKSVQKKKGEVANVDIIVSAVVK